MFAAALLNRSLEAMLFLTALFALEMNEFRLIRNYLGRSDVPSASRRSLRCLLRAGGLQQSPAGLAKVSVGAKGVLRCHHLQIGGNGNSDHRRPGLWRIPLASPGTSCSAQGCPGRFVMIDLIQYAWNAAVLWSCNAVGCNLAVFSLDVIHYLISK